MNVASSMAVAIAERVEKSGGPKAGLVAWRTVASNAPIGDVRARALLSAIRCAIAVTDLGALSELTDSWAFAGDGAWEKEIGAICKDLVRAGLLAAATALARTEVSRRRSARGLYLYARCLETGADPRAEALFADAVDLAEHAGDVALASAARVRRIAWLSRTLEHLPRAVTEAAKIDLARIPPASRIVVARALLRSPSRFVRAGAIAALDGVVTAGDIALAHRALAVRAARVDDAGDALTPLEIDRLLAVFGRDVALGIAPRAREALRGAVAVARAEGAELDAALAEAARTDPTIALLHRRVRDVLAGRFEAHAATDGAPASAWECILDAFVAMRDGVHARAAMAIGALADAEERGERVPPQAWNVVRLALAQDGAELRAQASRFVASRMARPAGAPPRGWLDLANVLAARGMTELADRARRAAAAAKEPGADDALVLWLTRSGWELAARGERALALARLREARALARGDARRDAAVPAPAPAARPAASPSR